MFQPVRAAYAFDFRELLPDSDRNSENYPPALVNNELASRPAFSPARQGGDLSALIRVHLRPDWIFSQLLTGGAKGRLKRGAAFVPQPQP